MKLAIISPTMRYMDAKTAFSIAGLAATVAQDPNVTDLTLKNLSIGYIDLSRTMLAYGVLTEQAVDAILWIDHDMLFPPDAFARLNAHQVPVVGALYRNRTPPHFERMEPYETNTQWVKDVTGWGGLPGCRPVNWLPGGLVLVRKEVYAALQMPFYRAGWGLDPAQPDAHIGEDIDFANRCREHDIAMWADMSLTEEVQHIAEVPLAWNLPGQTNAAKPGGVVGPV